VCPLILSPYICLKGKTNHPLCTRQPVGPLAPHAPYMCHTFFYGTWFQSSTRFYEHTLLALCVLAHPLNAVYFCCYLRVGSD
jgi:hypothetical protein